MEAKPGEACLVNAPLFCQQVVLASKERTQRSRVHCGEYLEPRVLTASKGIDSVKNRYLRANLTNSSQYISTNESFDAVALQSFEVRGALQERCREIQEDKGSLPKLTRDLHFLFEATGFALPFLPFLNAEERIKFSE